MSRPTVLVLAGGASNRLWPLRDKLLIEFGAQSLLERHLRQLRALHCDRFVVVARPDNAAAIEALLASLGARCRVAVQPDPLGMADAVLCAREALQALDADSLYVTQAHDVVGPVLHTAVLDALESGIAAGYVAAQRVSKYFPGGYLTLDGSRVTSVVEKPEPGSEPSDLVNLVAHGFGSWRDLVAAIEAETETALTALRERPAGWSPFPPIDDVYERALSRLMQVSEFRAVVYEGRWQALKYPWHVLDVMDMLLERWTSGAESPGAEYEQREEGVFVGKDVRIFPGAYVVGPALIGHGSVIGHNALVRGSILGPKCVIGFGSEIARSYLASGVELHHNYVGDSILDHDSAMGFGATTANYRLDGRTVPSRINGQRIDSGRMKLGLVLGAGTHVGVNTSTMPGIKIGAGAMVGANLRVSKDLPDGARLLDERSYGRF
jgi:bifunctional UDP-N-acetylglucosamine pyrophosphorylase/glucosamine-1-phosphate N-acetyltransferase